MDFRDAWLDSEREVRSPVCLPQIQTGLVFLAVLFGVRFFPLGGGP